MNLTIKGEIQAINETKTISESFCKRSIIIKEMTGEYPQTFNIEFVQDKCQILDKYKQGEQVAIEVDLRGREWINKEGELTAFNTLQGWKIDYAGQHADAIQGTKAEQVHADVDGDDDLPF